MANPFPQRKSQGAGGMTSSGPGSSGPLDGPPPSPAMAGIPNPPMTPGQGPQPMPSFGEMAQPLTPGTPTKAVPPEVAAGMNESVTVILGILDSMARIAPDLAVDFALTKDQLTRTMAKLVINNGQQAPPSALGSNYPGGGFLSGTP